MQRYLICLLVVLTGCTRYHYEDIAASHAVSVRIGAPAVEKTPGIESTSIAADNVPDRKSTRLNSSHYS